MAWSGRISNCEELNHDFIKTLFDYKDGWLYWKFAVNSKVPAGSKAGTINTNGYVVITINTKKIPAHRLIWLWHGKELPEQLDHINRDKADNRIENLRITDYETNARNAKIRTDNKSGYKGISWCNTYNKWVVQIWANKKKYSGRFKILDEAISFMKTRRKELHGEFACEGGNTK